MNNAPFNELLSGWLSVQNAPAEEYLRFHDFWWQQMSNPESALRQSFDAWMGDLGRELEALGFRGRALPRWNDPVFGYSPGGYYTGVNFFDPEWRMIGSLPTHHFGLYSPKEVAEAVVKRRMPDLMAAEREIPAPRRIPEFQRSPQMTAVEKWYRGEPSGPFYLKGRDAAGNMIWARTPHVGWDAAVHDYVRAFLQGPKEGDVISYEYPSVGQSRPKTAAPITYVESFLGGPDARKRRYEDYPL